MKATFFLPFGLPNFAFVDDVLLFAPLSSTPTSLRLPVLEAL